MGTILVTGGNRGIGLELVRLFAARGRDDVLAVCRTPSAELEALAAASPRVRIESGLDLVRDEAPQALAQRLAGRTLDVLVQNAGVLTVETLDALDVQAIRTQFEINALAPLRLTHALLPNLRSGSKVALITSRMGSIADNGSGGYYGYRMSKAALNMAGVSLAHDLRGRGVAVVILHPGFVRTQMTGGRGNVGPEQSAADLVKRIDELDLEGSGRFLHANGDPLPW
jgi:NAD(P)-dependent dehydrogenase (short-subunit alcohol dehydrogenase family)